VETMRLSSKTSPAPSGRPTIPNIGSSGTKIIQGIDSHCSATWADLPVLPCNQCFKLPPPAASTGGSGTCFHKDTLISYMGSRDLTMLDLEHHPECRIPHKVIADGVKIDMDSGHSLRLTNEETYVTS